MTKTSTAPRRFRSTILGDCDTPNRRITLVAAAVTSRCAVAPTGDVTSSQAATTSRGSQRLSASRDGDRSEFGTGQATTPWTRVRCVWRRAVTETSFRATARIDDDAGGARACSVRTRSQDLAEAPDTATSWRSALRKMIQLSREDDTAPDCDVRCPAVAEDELWDVAAVAAYLGVKRNTVTSYLARRQMPEPDYRFGQSPVWRASKIKAWHGGRPIRGNGPRSEPDRPQGATGGR